ncbi:hypothetical protein Fcan01_28150 [Folsomia candida]|uniref:SWIM-type domain-containing protein n=1 Tax=Folsomia candida TaxID=158441 RepID=A0A226CX15_FOLCA|nr:hypothetical protein Fcan01_28150 [Folsomia candida]
MWDAFCELVGDDWEKYSRTDLICNSCSADGRDQDTHAPQKRQKTEDDGDGVDVNNNHDVSGDFPGISPEVNSEEASPDPDLVLDSHIELLSDTTQMESQPVFDTVPEQIGSVDPFGDACYENADLSYRIDYENFSISSASVLNSNILQPMDQSVPVFESQISISVSASTVISSISSQCAQSSHIIHGIRGYSSSESRRFLCHNRSGRCRVPKEAIKETWLRKKVYISPGSRCCRAHLTDTMFTEETLQRIEGTQDKKNMKFLLGSIATNSIMVHKDQENLVRAKIQSRFRKSEGHHLWIKYIPQFEGPEAIQGYFCKCKNGARTVGMCSHICSVLWFLGYYLFHPELQNRRKKKSVEFLDALAHLHDVHNETDEGTEAD